MIERFVMGVIAILLLLNGGYSVLMSVNVVQDIEGYMCLGFSALIIGFLEVIRK